MGLSFCINVNCQHVSFRWPLLSIDLKKLFVEMNISNGKRYRSFRSNWIGHCHVYTASSDTQLLSLYSFPLHLIFVFSLWCVRTVMNAVQFRSDAFVHTLSYDGLIARWNQFSVVSSFMAFVILIFLSASKFDSAIDIARQTDKTAVNFCFPSHGRWKSNVCHIVTERDCRNWIAYIRIWYVESNLPTTSAYFPPHFRHILAFLARHSVQKSHETLTPMCVSFVFEFRDMGAFFRHTFI